MDITFKNAAFFSGLPAGVDVKALGQMVRADVD